MNVPKIRFKEFSEEWIQVKLNNYATKITKKNKNLIINNVISNSAIYGLISQRDFFDKDIANNDNLSSYYIIENNDFVYNPRKSNEAPYGPINRYTQLQKGVISPLYLCFSVKNINELFLEKYFKSNKWHRYIYLNGDSGARADRVSIKDDLFFNQSIYIPSMKEQSKIANTLELLDKKIELQSKKIEALKLYKKGLIISEFSNSNLREISIKELGRIITGTTPSKDNNIYWENGNIAWITPTDITYYKDINSSSTLLTSEGLKKGRFIPKNSILITCIASIGKNAKLLVDGSCNQQINAIIPDKQYNSDYIYYLMEYMEPYFKSIAGTTATSIINKETFENIKVKIHSPEKREFIGNFLNYFENKILLEDLKLENLRKIKKGFMQNMFV